jgi:hypothetical protein
MKKLFVAATLGLALVSCGGPSVCGCAQTAKDMFKESMDAKDDTARKAVEEKYKSHMEECEKFVEGKTDEELKEMQKEAENCK